MFVFVEIDMKVPKDLMILYRGLTQLHLGPTRGPTRIPQKIGRIYQRLPNLRFLTYDYRPSDAPSFGGVAQPLVVGV